MSEERKTHQTVPSKVAVGNLIAFTYYTKVTRVDRNGDLLTVQDLDNSKGEIRIDGRNLVESALTADLYEETEKVSKTRAAELLVSSHNRPLTVCFDKADGTERVMRGRLIKPEPLLGRSMVEDLDSTDAHRMRQVDHRTIKFLVVDGMRYDVK